jgi:hypothetical protein
MKKKTFCFDIDNTICKTFKNHYSKSRPYKTKIKIINMLFDKGHKIILFTARGMSKYNGNKSIVKKKLYNFTKKQLCTWNIKYHKLFIGKPSYDIFIDDKYLNFNKNWHKIILQKFLL